MAEGHDSKQAREAFEAAERNKNEPIPEAERGGHDKSHAAHLQTEGKAHTIPEGNHRQAVNLGHCASRHKIRAESERRSDGNNALESSPPSGA